MAQKLLHIDRIEENIVLLQDDEEKLYSLSREKFDFPVEEAMVVLCDVCGDTVLLAKPFRGDDPQKAKIGELSKKLFH